MIEAGVLGLRLAPIATGFWREAQAKIDAQNSAKAQVDVTANIRRASSEIAMFRMREQANAINLRVKVDEKSIRAANEKIKYIEHTWKQSDIKRAIRLQVFVAGATALPALTQGIVSLTAAMTELSRVAVAVPGLLAGVGASAATLITGVNGVGQAFKAFGQGMKQTEQYSRQYSQATRQLENAQRDVVKALRDANREIEDQKDKLARGQLSVEQAQLNVRRANERMFQGGFQNITDYQQSLLDIKQANLDLADAVKQNGRNIQDYYAEAAKGATETNTYKDAVDRLANSVDAFHKAQFEAMGMNEQFISAMKMLAPAGQDFVLEVLKLKGAWQGLQNSIQTTLFSGLGAEITNLANRQLPLLKTGMQRTAEAINNDFKVLFQSLGRQSNVDNISKIFNNTGQALKAAAPGLDSFSGGLLKLSEVGTRFLPRMALAFDRVMARFEAFVNRADKDGSLNRWIDSGLKLVSSLGRSLLDIGSILGSITAAYNRATGNIGGFASTMERGLDKLSKYLASPQGQNALISWMRTSREFMHTIGQALPGIRQMFGIVGDAARDFASHVFPLFAKLGNMFGQNSNWLVKTILEMGMAIRTVRPIWSQGTKALHALNAALDKHTQKKADLVKSRNVAWKDAFDAEGMRFAAQNNLNELRRDLNELDSRNENGLLNQLKNGRAKALDDLNKAKKDAAAAKKDARKAEAAVNSDLLIPGFSKDDQTKFSKQQAKVFEDAKKRETAAQAEFDRWDKSYSDAHLYRAKRRMEAERQMPLAYRDLRNATNLAAEAQKNFEKVSKLTASGFQGSWARGVDFLKGKLTDLRGAMKAVLAGITGLGATIGITAALDMWSAAMERAKASADSLKASQEALAQTLAKGTGSATAATIEENTRQLRDRFNPVHPDDKNQNFDAINILQHQLGMSPDEIVRLTLPTEVKAREARLAPADQAIISAVPSLQEWKTWGGKYRENGVTQQIYGRALNGDPESIGKVEAARRAIKDSNPLGQGVNMGIAANTGLAPNDLGGAQEQLDRSGPNGGLRGLSLAVGAERSIGNSALARGQAEFNNSQSVPQKGLNAVGMRVFGPFVLGAHGAILKPDYSGVIEVDRYPDDVVPGWVQGASGNGISVERRYPRGAIISIDPEHSLKYFNGFANGGSVWGAGTATSDSIPAMLSNGEFVINAKSAAAIGHDNLRRMNSLKFSGGGSVGDEPGFNGENGNIFSQAFGWLRDHNLIPFLPAPTPDRNAAALAHGIPPATIGMPYVSVPVDSSPVELPYTPPPEPQAPKGIGGNIGGGVLYVPDLSGSGALKDSISYPGFVGTDASAAKNAPINPNANILDYLVQVANANGLRPGSGPASTTAGDAGSQIAARLGIPTHDNDGAQHSVDRALDIGSPEQAKDGSITRFVKSWLADPQKVASTRQLIYQDPTTGEVFAIHHGVAYTGKAAWDIYGSDFSGHQDHVHLALEGVPLEAFSQTGAGAPVVPNSISTPPSVPAGPASSAPGPTAIAPPGQSAGPAGATPDFLDPFYFLRQIAAAILKGILGFFGIDGSAFIDALFAIGDNKKVGPQVDQIPEPDQNLIASLDTEIAKYEAIGTPQAKSMAENLKKSKADYLKQFEGANAAKSANTAADYFDSIGQHDVATNLRNNANVVADPKNPERFGPVTTVPGTGGTPTVLPRPGNIGLAPAAAYSGGTPEVHNAVYRAFREAGYPDSEWPALVQLLNHENDTWDPTRPTGGPNSDARGIFQFLSSTWGAVGMTPSDDPYTQAVAGMKYIKQNYATPTGAWLFWQHPTRPPFDQNWYSLGGLIKLAGGGFALRPRLPGDPVDPGDFLANYDESNYGPSILAFLGGGMPHLVFPEDNAAGGFISGPGGPTDDKIPAMLSNGEFVMRAAAVKHWGVNRLHAMNKLSHFDQGGLVVNGYAPGGLIGDSGEGVNNLVSEANKKAQKQFLLSAFAGNIPAPSGSDSYSYGKDSANVGADWVGGGGDFNSSPAATAHILGGLGQFQVPKWLSGASRWVGENINPVNILNWEDSKLGGSRDKNGLVWNALGTAMSAINPGFGLIDAFTGRKGNSARQTLPLLFPNLDLVNDAVTMSDPQGAILDRLGAFANTMGVVAPVGGKGVSKTLEAIDMAALRAKNLKDLPILLDGMSWGTQREIKNALARLIEIYPTAGLNEVVSNSFSKDVGIDMVTGRLKMPSSAFARASEVEGARTKTGLYRSIEINTDWFSDRKKLYKSYMDAVNKGWLVDPGSKKNIIAAILSHEYGHIMDFHFGDTFYPWDIEQMLRNNFTIDTMKFLKSTGGEYKGLTGDPSVDTPVGFINYLRHYFPHMYSYTGKSVEEFSPETVRLMRQEKLYGNGLDQALRSIDRNELVANSFAEVFLHGNKASIPSKEIYQLWREASDAYDRYSFFGTGKKTVLPKILPRNPGRSSKVFDAIPSMGSFYGGGLAKGPGGPRSDMIPAMLSNGEFVMNSAATKHWGVNRLQAMNKFADGGAAYLEGKKPPEIGANAYEAGKGQIDPGAVAYSAGKRMAAGLGSIGPRLGGGGGGGGAVNGTDPRATIAAAPTSDVHIHPALASGIKGAFSTIGSIASQAAAFGGAAASAGVTGGVPVPGAGEASAALVNAGFQMAGDVAVGAANVLSAFLVGTATPSQTGQGYGAPLLPQQQNQPAVSNFQSIHNGNIVTNNLSEYSRLKDRKDAQKAAPFFNRVGR